MSADCRTIGKIRLEIGNAGTTFSVVDRGFGPAILIESSAFGNQTLTYEILTNPESLRALAEVLNNASQNTFSETYVHAACVKASVEYNDYSMDNDRVRKLLRKSGEMIAYLSTLNGHCIHECGTEHCGNDQCAVCNLYREIEEELSDIE